MSLPSLTLTAAYANTVAAVMLTFANELGLAFGAPICRFPFLNELWKLLIFGEGVFFSIAAALLFVFQKDVMKSFRGAMAQAIICIGGFFFAMSAYQPLHGLNPPKLKEADIVSKGYMMYMLLSHSAYIGISCFMIGTAIGFSTVIGLPWDFKYPNRKTGVLCFMIGAWTIGVFHLFGTYFFGPGWHMAVGRFAAVLGSFFLALGAGTFHALEYQTPA